MALTLRPHIAEMPVYRAGKSAQPGPDGRAWKLSSNENPYGPLPGVLEAVTASLAEMNRYPDAGNSEITAAVATRHGLAEERVAFGTGSVEVLAHLIEATCGPGDEVVYAWRSFEAYPLVVQVLGARSVQVPLTATGEHDLEAMLAAITPRTRVVMLCTPNNPTGPAIPHDDIVEFLGRVREDIVVIVDEAYVEYVTDPDATRGLELFGVHPGVVTLRTFSKAYGLAGLRVGWMAAADPVLAQAVRSVTMPFAISSPAQVAVMASLAAEPELIGRVRVTVHERDRIAAELRAMGHAIPATQGNFVWFPAAGRTEEWFDAFRHAGLMTRAFTGEGLRVSIAEPDANDRILAVARGLLA
ncbi:histidinol-phosphate aminotransferase [Raineyella antarctica]|uniref:Aromatic amino acid aminotransferase n=1 Tax=Raineyella antarctica TaxID=1577474 RepID=A0A1G6GDZ3_9ACTN|nr:histidinol-phosphate transaminase [Raineyella antarctica]SDB80221.1 histidinol-phosphate aminotransferase [Raineyella antarctica]